MRKYWLYLSISTLLVACSTSGQIKQGKPEVRPNHEKTSNEKKDHSYHVSVLENEKCKETENSEEDSISCQQTGRTTESILKTIREKSPLLSCIGLEKEEISGQSISMRLTVSSSGNVDSVKVLNIGKRIEGKRELIVRKISKWKFCPGPSGSPDLITIPFVFD